MLTLKAFMNSLPVGTPALKVGGSYQAAGVIVGNFKTTTGEQRYVFEFVEPKGMLHIFGPSQVVAIERRGLE